MFLGAGIFNIFNIIRVVPITGIYHLSGIFASVTELAAHARAVCVCAHNFSYDFINPRQNVKNWSVWFPAVHIDSTFNISANKCT
jgi:hypothetical protein